MELREVKREILDGMIDIAREGAVIGVLYNDEELNYLKKEFETLNVLNNLAEARPLFDSMFEREFVHSNKVDHSFFAFLRENHDSGFTSHPRGSGYEKILHFESVRLGMKYVFQARREFPTYSFIFTEALNEDRTENLFAHSDITAI